MHTSEEVAVQEAPSHCWVASRAHQEADRLNGNGCSTVGVVSCVRA